MKRLVVAAMVPMLFGTGLAAEEMNPEDRVKRGEYIVATSGCNDCHTPWIMGDNGPQTDMGRMLSGHPSEIEITQQASLTPPWEVATSGTNTAISGPWGITFTANLTPDETGVLSQYSEDQFVAMMRSGLRQGQGRPILPPMPWPVYGQLTDDDLKAVFAYLRTIPPVANKVPDPLPPMAVPASN